jgi:hypothetical protein
MGDGVAGIDTEGMVVMVVGVDTGAFCAMLVVPVEAGATGNAWMGARI